MIVISVIIGSTRQGRFSEKPAEWVFQHFKKRSGVEARLLDLRDFPMLFFDQPVPPAKPDRAPYEHEVVKSWTAHIGASDGFVFVTPEYNYGPAAVLKNTIDWVYPEWNRKATAFVSYGSCALEDHGRTEGWLMQRGLPLQLRGGVRNKERDRCVALNVNPHIAQHLRQHLREVVRKRREIAADGVPAVGGFFHLLGHIDQRGVLGIPDGGNTLGVKMQKALAVGFDLNRDRAFVVDLADL